MSSFSKSSLKVASLIAIAVSISACSGGGGGNDDDDNNGTPQPVLLGSGNSLRLLGTVNSAGQTTAINLGNSSVTATIVPGSTVGTTTIKESLKVVDTDSTNTGTYIVVDGTENKADDLGFGKTTNYQGASISGIVSNYTITKIDGKGDRFFFFDLKKSASGGFVNSVGAHGTLTESSASISNPSNRTLLPTTPFTNGEATFVGKGTIRGAQQTNSNGVIKQNFVFGGAGNLLMKVNSTSGAVSGEINSLSHKSGSVVSEIIGGKVVLNETKLNGAQFNIGSISLKNAAGADIAAFNSTNSFYSGGVYGANAENVAGAYNGVAAVNGVANQQLWIQGLFYGDRQ